MITVKRKLPVREGTRADGGVDKCIGRVAENGLKTILRSLNGPLRSYAGQPHDEFR